MCIGVTGEMLDWTVPNTTPQTFISNSLQEENGMDNHQKVAIVIPAYNEERTVGRVIEEIPREIEGVDSVRVIVVSDGSTDGTENEAKKAGADRIITFKQNMGLSRAFKAGLEAALETDADIIVSIDADGQYVPGEIPKLIEPIIKQEADIVLGSRFKGHIEHMPLKKKIGNIIATKVTRFVSGFPVSDAQTGFRAFSREAALRLNIFSDYTYVQETIIQAVHKDFTIVEIPCNFRRREDESRLVSSMFTYIKGAGSTIVRTSLYYKPLKTFLYIGGVFLLGGFLTGLKVHIHFIRTGQVGPYYPTIILTAFLILIGFQIIVLGLLADITDRNRRLQEEVLYRLKKKG